MMNVLPTRFVSVQLSLFLDSSLDSCATCPPKIVKLRHLKTDSAAMFLHNPATRSLCEVLAFSEDHRILLATKIDHRFLLLPYLAKVANNFINLSPDFINLSPDRWLGLASSLIREWRNIDWFESGIEELSTILLPKPRNNKIA